MGGREREIDRVGAMEGWNNSARDRPQSHFEKERRANDIDGSHFE